MKIHLIIQPYSPWRQPTGGRDGTVWSVGDDDMTSLEELNGARETQQTPLQKRKCGALLEIISSPSIRVPWCTCADRRSHSLMEVGRPS